MSNFMQKKLELSHSTMNKPLSPYIAHTSYPGLPMNWIEVIFIPLIQKRLIPLDTGQVIINYYIQQFVNTMQLLA